MPSLPTVTVRKGKSERVINESDLPEFEKKGWKLDEPAATVSEQPTKPLMSHTLKELRAIAALNDVDVAGLKTKSQVSEALREAGIGE